MSLWYDDGAVEDDGVIGLEIGYFNGRRRETDWDRRNWRRERERERERDLYINFADNIHVHVQYVFRMVVHFYLYIHVYVRVHFYENKIQQLYRTTQMCRHFIKIYQ